MPRKNKAPVTLLHPVQVAASLGSRCGVHGIASIVVTLGRDPPRTLDLPSQTFRRDGPGCLSAGESRDNRIKTKPAMTRPDAWLSGVRSTLVVRRPGQQHPRLPPQM